MTAALQLIGAGIISALSPPKPAINIAPTVMDFGGQSEHRLRALAAAATKIAQAAIGGNAYAAMLRPSDFHELERFVEFARSEFALAGLVVRDDAVDQPHSRDESHFLDQERI